MGNRFDAKHAFAFGIDLEGQLAAVQLEDRQIMVGLSTGGQVDYFTTSEGW
jgi:CHASE2 domain-containing sensor protein